MFFIRTGWYLLFGLVFGVLSFMRTNAYKQQTGSSPWHIHPIVWGVASVFVAIFGTLLSIIACSTRARTASGPSRFGAGTDYVQGPDLGGSPGTAMPEPRALAAWLPDPTGRHELRYFDGSAWTEHVANGGSISDDRI